MVWNTHHAFSTLLTITVQPFSIILVGNQISLPNRALL